MDHKIPLITRVDKKMNAMIIRDAKLLGRSRSNWLRTVISFYFNNKK